MLMRTKEEAPTVVVPMPDGEPHPVTIRNYVGESGQVGDGGPQGGLFTIVPDLESRAHFHPSAQFQVFFGEGGATFGPHEMGPLYVHYADKETPYGPFKSGAVPLEFFTLRARGSVGAFYMPESRDKMVRKPGRNLSKSVSLDAALPAEASCTALIGPEPDKVAAFHLRVPAGTDIVGPSPKGTGGHYYMVVRGDMQCEGKSLPFQSCMWVGPQEAAPQLVAGAQGLDAIVVQYANSDNP